MWTRAQLKDKAKIALKGNYWRVVLVTLIVILIGGASISTGASANSNDFQNGFENGFDAGFGPEYGTDEFYFGGGIEDALGFLDIATIGMFVALFFGVLVVIVLIAFVISFLLSVFIYNPLEVGTKRFFFQNLNYPAEVKEVMFAFDHNYKNVIKILFYRELYLLGWSLLFVIPGIIKSYEYFMVPYLLAENPNLTKEQAFTLSKQMMTGNKWDAFVLDLSFIGWELLSAFTFGILSIFYVEPYKNLTHAAFYEEISLINGRPATAMYQNMDDMSYSQNENFENREEI